MLAALLNKATCYSKFCSPFSGARDAGKFRPKKRDAGCAVASSVVKKGGTEVPPEVECSISWKLISRGDGLACRDAGRHHIPGGKANIAEGFDIVFRKTAADDLK